MVAGTALRLMQRQFFWSGWKKSPMWTPTLLKGHHSAGRGRSGKKTPRATRRFDLWVATSTEIYDFLLRLLYCPAS